MHGHHHGSRHRSSGKALPLPDAAAIAQKVDVDTLPTDILTSFQQAADNDEDILIALGTDLSTDGTYGNRYLLVSSKRVCVVTPNGKAPDLEQWPVKEISDISVENLVGQAALIGIVNGVRVEMCRFSNARQRDFHRVAKVIERLAEGNEDLEDYHEKDELERFCSSCGRLLPEPGGVCPACLRRGQVLMRLVEYLKPHWRRAVMLVSLMIVSASIQTLPPYLTKILVDNVLISESMGEIAFWDVSGMEIGRIGWLVIIVSLFLVSRLLLLVIQVLSGRLTAWLGPNVIGDLRREVYHHMQKLGLGYYDRASTGVLLNRVMTDTSRVQGFLIDGVPHVGIELFMGVFIGCILFTMNWQLTLFIMVPLPITIYTSKFFWRYIRGLFGRAWGRRAILTSRLNDALSGVRVVKAFGQEDQEFERFSYRNTDLVGAESRAEQTWATYFPLITFGSMLGTFIVWYIGGAKVIGNTMTLGTLMAFFAYLNMFYRPIQMISRINAWVTRDLTAAERIFEILDTDPEIKDLATANTLDDLKGEVRFEDVWFGYDPIHPVIKGISIDIQPGEMVGLVGRSGAGKTTIINLICRFYDPQEGRLLIDGKDMRTVRQRDWHHNLGIVPQESFLFHGTISENIAYARPEATRDDIIRAARAANAHHFIMRFNDGYDTQVGERGARLSGGERQRISIARAILHDPKILILDEATSSVDTETEQQIQEAISRLVKGRTVFAIAHRLSTLKNANRLLVIDDGKVAEFGSHDELIKMDGVYAKLVMAQTSLNEIQAV
jgi:ATP-binding cassette, subfamily B, bacterial